MAPTEEVLPNPANGAVLGQPVVRPVDRSERISAIDTLRGFALLGILLMNIVGFGLYYSAYDNPTVAGGATGVNLWTWIVLHVLAEGKMRCLFSLVFGASVVLLTSRSDPHGMGGDIYYRRTLWLLLFGIVHAFLLWQGEILYPYALCGLALYPLRRLSARALFIFGGTLLTVLAVIYVGLGFETRDNIEKGRAAEKAAKEGQKLTEEQEEAKKKWEDIRKANYPTPEEIKKDADQWNGNFLSVVKRRAKDVMPWHSMPYYHPFMWDMFGMMLVGMALFKTGVLSGERSFGFYWGLVIAGYSVGGSVNSFSAYQIVQSNFDPVVRQFSAVTYDVGRFSIAAGHLGALMLLCKSGAMNWLTARLAAVGQMAFSNYIFHSVVCSFIFTGYGFAMFGKLQRHQLYYVVGAVWLFQMIVSPIWLRHYRMGPLEWCWRSLTYWKRQPMRLRAAE